MSRWSTRLARLFIIAASVVTFANVTYSQSPCRIFLENECSDMVVGETQLLNAYARPQGGTFQWTATVGGANISPNSGTDGTFVFDAVAGGQVEIVVTYTSSLGCVVSHTCNFRVYNDADGDGVGDSYDDCPDIYDPDQSDSDGDGTPDVCEPAANCYLSYASTYAGFSAASTATVTNTGFVADTFYYELYQSQPGGNVYVSGTTGYLTLNPGESTDLTFFFAADPASEEGTPEFTLVVISSYGKLVSQCSAIITVLKLPPPPPPCKVDIIVHRPKVIHSGEPAVLENKEDDPGVTTFVNNDNDDDDDYFDNDDSDNIVNGEKEMVKTILRIQPANLAAGNLKLKATKGPLFIVVWAKDNKDVMYINSANITIPVNTLVKSADNQWLETTVWVEGIEAHTEKQGTILELTYDQDATCKDTAAITIVGVKDTKWLGIKNGFTGLSAAFNSDTLDTVDPNFPAGALKSYAVFPDGRSKDVTGNAADAPDKLNDKVKLEIELTVAPPENFDLYVRAFDIDDPSAETTRIDPNDLGGASNYSGTGNPISGGALNYDKNDDNRGRVDGKKFGKFDGDDGKGFAKMVFPAGQAKKTIDFQVSQYAGDNYRVAAHAHREYLEKLRNEDKLDGLEIVDPKTKNAGTGKPEPWPLPYSSHVVTVWRMLHVERDSMKAPAGNENRATGAIEAIVGATKVLTISDNGVVVNGNLEPDLSFTDKSPAPNGRFQNGKFTQFASLASAADIATNTSTTFTMKNALEPACTLTKGLVNKATKVTDLSYDGATTKSTVTVADALTANQFNDGTITIGLQTFNVESNTATTVLLKAKATLNFIAVDDDNDALLPEPDLADNGHMAEAYSGVYIWPVYDGGGKGDAFDTKTANFTANLPKDETAAGYVAETEGFYKRDSAALEKNSFWVVYVLSSFQYEFTEDADPFGEPEGATGGIVVDATGQLSTVNVAKGGKGCTVYLETIDDRLNKTLVGAAAQAGLEARVVAHEIGHQFGLAHNTGVMTSSQQNGPAPGAAFQFSNADKNLLRCRLKSPGE